MVTVAGGLLSTAAASLAANRQEGSIGNRRWREGCAARSLGLGMAGSAICLEMADSGIPQERHEDGDLARGSNPNLSCCEGELESEKTELNDEALLYESSVVERFVPAMLLESFKKNNSKKQKAKFSKHYGIVGFFDVSGYSKLSSELERVYSQRKRTTNFSSAISDQFSNTRPLAGVGAEELAEQLNITLGELVDLILSSGGDVIKFAGDAILAFWEADKGTCCGHAYNGVFSPVLGLE